MEAYAIIHRPHIKVGLRRRRRRWCCLFDIGHRRRPRSPSTRAAPQSVSRCAGYPSAPGGSSRRRTHPVFVRTRRTCSHCRTRRTSTRCLRPASVAVGGEKVHVAANILHLDDSTPRYVPAPLHQTRIAAAVLLRRFHVTGRILVP